MENTTTMHKDACNILLKLIQSDLSDTEMLNGIESLPKIGISGFIVGILSQLEGLLGKEIGPQYEWKDSAPELSRDHKKAIIVQELESYCNEESANYTVFFSKIIAQIVFNGTQFSVVELLVEPWCYTLFQAKEFNCYFLDLMHHHSSAAWSIIYKLTQTQGEELLANPSYDNARWIASKAEAEQRS